MNIKKQRSPTIWARFVESNINVLITSIENRHVCGVVWDDAVFDILACQLWEFVHDVFIADWRGYKRFAQR